MHKRGFTLLELLVVIAILGILSALGLSSFSASQKRARDSKRKNEVAEVRTALQLYYTDYQSYPVSSSMRISGCGANGTQVCPVCGLAEFASGGSDGCANIYMKKLPGNPSGFTFSYYQYSGGEDFRLVTTLEDDKDIGISESQDKCPKEVGSWGVGEYVVCAY